MRARARWSSAVVLVLLSWSAVHADPVGRRLELSPFAGVALFDGDHRIHGHSLADVLDVGGRLAVVLHPAWAIEGAFGFAPSREDTTGGPDVDVYHGSGNLMWTPWGGRHGGPFAFAGAGALQTSAGSVRHSRGSFEVGGGLKWWLTDALGVRLEARQIFTHADPGDRGVAHFVLGGGLTLAIGARARDTDQDGVPDSKDTCEETPKGATVDLGGCPKDSDFDGVLDGLDQCAGTPKGATVDEKGWPRDRDGDGVLDGLDQCEDTPKGATVDTKGCPRDSDGDGVLDGLDQCAGTPKGATVDGKGCPRDSDQDGVLDGLDRCPDTAPGLRVDPQGCVIEYLEKETEMLDTGMIRLEDVRFETNQARLLPESFHALDLVGQTLEHWPELTIEIGGHTDSRGGSARNQKLSEARADSVMAYLTAKFPSLKLEQFTARGYGQSRPVVPNNSELNMAKNRRVEFVVLNKDVLMRAIEHRRTLKQEGTPADTTRH